jgi:hypothetical protein
MRTHLAHVVSILAFAAVGLTATAASAQRVVVEEEGGGYTRLRAGIDLTGGGLLLDGYGIGLVGVDGRLGVQANNLLAIYAQAHLVFGGGSCGGGTCGTGLPGLFSVSAVADFTFDRIFVGAGGGFVYIGDAVNAGPELIGRFGFYPLMRRGRFGGRRGLMIGADVHLDYIPGGGGAAFLEPMFLIGYEAF